MSNKVIHLGYLALRGFVIRCINQNIQLDINEKFIRCVISSLYIGNGGRPSDSSKEPIHHKVNEYIDYFLSKTYTKKIKASNIYLMR